MRKKPSPHDAILNEDTKKVSWGKDQTLIIAPSWGKKQLAETINSGDSVAIYNVLQNINHDKAAKYLTADEGLAMRVGLMKIAVANSTSGKHDSESLKKVIYKFMEFDQETIRENFFAFNLCHTREKNSIITEHFLSDYHEAMRQFRDFKNKHTALKEENPDHLPQEEAKGVNHDDASATDSTNPATDDQGVQTRAILSGTDEEEVKVKHDNKENKLTESTSGEGTDPTSLLNHILSWIHQLPEYLRSQILNSAPVKALIESTEQISAIYDIKTVEELFAKLLPTDPEAVDGTEDNVNDKAMVSESLIDAIDMTMVLEEPSVNGWILPMVDVSSGFNYDHAFNEIEHFHGFDIF